MNQKVFILRTSTALLLSELSYYSECSLTPLISAPLLTTETLTHHLTPLGFSAKELTASGTKEIYSTLKSIKIFSVYKKAMHV